MNDIHGLLLMLIGYLIGTSNFGKWLHGSMTMKDDDEDEER